MCGETGGMVARASRCHGTRIEQVASFAHVPQNVSRKDKGRRKEKRKRKRKKKENKVPDVCMYMYMDINNK
jgi:hypothetical protein